MTAASAAKENRVKQKARGGVQEGGRLGGRLV